MCDCLCACAHTPAFEVPYWIQMIPDPGWLLEVLCCMAGGKVNTHTILFSSVLCFYYNSQEIAHSSQRFITWRHWVRWSYPALLPRDGSVLSARTIQEGQLSVRSGDKTRATSEKPSSEVREYMTFFFKVIGIVGSFTPWDFMRLLPQVFLLCSLSQMIVFIPVKEKQLGLNVPLLLDAAWPPTSIFLFDLFYSCFPRLLSCSTVSGVGRYQQLPPCVGAFWSCNYSPPSENSKSKTPETNKSRFQESFIPAYGYNYTILLWVIVLISYCA